MMIETEIDLDLDLDLDLDQKLALDPHINYQKTDNNNIVK